MLLPVILLLLFELALRLFNSGYPSGFFVSHPSTGTGRWVENQKFSWRFFPRTLARYPDPMVIDSQKPPATYRIVVMGESAAQGDPAPAFGFSRILQVLLRDRYPEARFEFVNTAFTAINSHVIAEIARDCTPLEADLWLIYMGHNEVVGPFGMGSVFGRPLPGSLIRAQLIFKATRTGQLLESLLNKLRRDSHSSQGWGGMSMFLDQPIRQDDPRLATSHAQFQANLDDVLNLAQTAETHVVLSTTVARLRDWAPFNSAHPTDWSSLDEQEWTRSFQSGVASQNAHDWSLAITNFSRAAQIDPLYAELQYRIGQCLLALDRDHDAREHFIRARDADALRFRADSALNHSIRRIASERTNRNLTLLDAEHIFETLSPHGIPGREWLIDHVHLTFTGNYQLARLFADAVVAALAMPERDTGEQDAWLSETDCAAQLAYTDTQRHAIVTLVQHRLQEPVYSSQIDHAETLVQLDQELVALRGASRPAALRQALETTRKAILTAPEDWRLHELSARLFNDLGLVENSIQAWNRTAGLIPHAPRPHIEMGNLWLQQANTSRAWMAFQRAIQLNPHSARAEAGLGNCLQQLGKDAQAMRHLHRALRLDPTCGEAISGLSKLRTTTP